MDLKNYKIDEEENFEVGNRSIKIEQFVEQK